MHQLFSSYLKSFFKTCQNHYSFIFCNAFENPSHSFNNLWTLSTFLLLNEGISFNSLIRPLHKMVDMEAVAEVRDKVANMCHYEVKME